MKIFFTNVAFAYLVMVLGLLGLHVFVMLRFETPLYVFLMNRSSLELATLFALCITPLLLCIGFSFVRDFNAKVLGQK